MKFGVLYHKTTDNLSDDIQTYAALRFLPRADYFIDRENLDSFSPNEAGQVAAIFGGWFLHKKYHWPPSPAIYPLCTGMHFEKQDLWGLGYDFLDGAGGQWLAAHGPVGCADESSLRACENRRIEAFLSGPLTLTLPRQTRPAGQGGYVLAVDAPAACVGEIGRQIGAEDVRIKEASCAVDYLNEPLPMEDRMDRVADLLALCRNARCVLTVHPHCALACLAMGTPVLLLTDGAAPEERTSDFAALLHTEDARRFGLGMADYNVLAPLENPTAYEPLRDALNKRVQGFVAECLGKEQPVPQPGEAECAELVQWRQGLLARAADASFERISALDAENLRVYTEREETEAHLSRALMEAENRREEIIVQFDYLWQENIRIRDVERQASHHLDIIAHSRSFSLFRILQAGLRELKSLNPVRWGRYLAAIFARLAGKKARLHQYRLLDPLLQVQRYLSTQAHMGVPGYDLATRYCYVPMNDDTWRRTAELLALVRKHKKVVWILAPMFRDSVLTDGYFRRIKAIDDILGDDVHRIYLSQLYLADKNIPIPVAIDFATQSRWEITYNRGDDVQERMLKAMIDPEDIFYSHSVEQISAIATDGFHTGPLFVDMHGISPEEHAMHGDLVSAQRAGDQEDFVAKAAHRIIVVTQAMGEHYQEKYPGFAPGIITMPILETALDVGGRQLAFPPLQAGRPVVVYAGALQKWQQIPLMQDAIAARAEDFAFRVFTNKPDDFMELWGSRPVPSVMEVGTRSVEDLKAEYAQCHYGFALREDSEVNRVSCPTKLVEYLEYGIVPILQTPRVGDFVRLGMQYVPLEDFLAGKLPDEEARRRMAQENLQVLARINDLFKNGRAALLAALGIEKKGGGAQ